MPKVKEFIFFPFKSQHTKHFVVLFYFALLKYCTALIKEILNKLQSLVFTSKLYKNDIVSRKKPYDIFKNPTSPRLFFILAH